MDFVAPITILEPAKHQHGVFVHHCSVFVKALRRDITLWLGLELAPLKRLQVKSVDMLVACKVKTATKQHHRVVVYNRRVMRECT